MPRADRTAYSCFQEDSGEVQHRPSSQGSLRQTWKVFQGGGVVSTKVANAQLGIGVKTLAGDAGTRTDAIAAVASAGGKGVDSVILGILLLRIFATD